MILSVISYYTVYCPQKDGQRTQQLNIQNSRLPTGQRFKDTADRLWLSSRHFSITWLEFFIITNASPPMPLIGNGEWHQSVVGVLLPPALLCVPCLSREADVDKLFTAKSIAVLQGHSQSMVLARLSYFFKANSYWGVHFPYRGN